MKLARLLALVLPLFAVAAHAEPERGPAVALRQTYAALAVRLAASPFGRPLVLESRQSDGRVQGAVYAVVDHAFDELKSALDGTRQWCEVLILHLNVKDCRSTPGGGLAVFLGRKTPQPPEQAQRLDFDYRTVAHAADFMEAVVEAESGNYVYVVDAEGKAETRPVVVGRAVGEDVIVDRGVKMGETVVTDGQLRLVPGAKVQVRNLAGPGGSPGAGSGDSTRASPGGNVRRGRP